MDLLSNLTAPFVRHSNPYNEGVSGGEWMAQECGRDYYIY